jgi:hypothetical protein
MTVPARAGPAERTDLLQILLAGAAIVAAAGAALISITSNHAPGPYTHAALVVESAPAPAAAEPEVEEELALEPAA